MNKKPLIVLLICSLLLNALQNIVNHSKNDRAEVNSKSIDIELEKKLMTCFDKRYQEIQAEIKSKESNLFKSLQNNGLDESLKNSDNPVIVFRYHSTNCEPCIMVEKNNMITFLEKEPDHKVVFLVSGFNNREILDIKNDFKINVNVVSFPEDLLNSNLEDYRIPYYCLLDQKLKPYAFFIPDAESPNLTMKYFELF